MRRTASLLIATVLLAATAGCSGGGAQPQASNQAQSIELALADTTATPADVAAVSASLGQFATGLFQEISAEKSKDPNVFLSPASIQQVLVLMLAATDGATHEQLRKALRLDLPDERLFPAVTALWRQTTQAQYTFSNSNWGLLRDTAQLSPDYVSLVSKYMGAEFSTDSFADPAALAQRINSAVSEKTKGMVKELVSSDMLTDPALFLVLLNAVYFQGDWVDTFSGQTWEAPFTKWSGKRGKATMMMRESVTTYMRGKGFTAVELPYQGGASMLVVLPDKGKFDAVAKTLDGPELVRIRSAIAAAGSPGTELIMPRFSFATADPIDLKRAVVALGAPGLFKKSADWGPLLMPPEKEALVGFLVHKASLKVDQKGTEAAAATAGGITAGAAPGEVIPPIEVDRPFILTIQDTANDAVMFMGRIGDPAQK